MNEDYMRAADHNICFCLTDLLDRCAGFVVAMLSMMGVP